MNYLDRLENLAEVLRAIEPDLELKLAFCQKKPPDPATQPVTSSIVAAYISRLELELTSIRSGARGLQDQFREQPNLIREINEIESWIARRRPGVPRRQLTDQDAEVLGDWYVSKMGYSYSETNRRIAEIRKLLGGRGAPNKRPETLKMFDARVANGWSYQEIADHMCDCGSRTHAGHCADRIRKRIKELEAFLIKYKISYDAVNPT
jgi:hypothetical protein